MRIVFMGTPNFALTILESLFYSGHELIGVVTQPDKRGNRGAVCPPPVKTFAEEHGIPVFQYAKLRTDGAADLRGLGADIFVTAAYGQILSREILDIAPLGTVNVHASVLPAYRGSCPVQRAIMNGDKQTGVTIMQTAEGLDTGDILLVKKTEILKTDTAETLLIRLGKLGAEALIECLAKLERGEIVPTAQDDGKASYYPMLTKADGLIDWTRAAEEIDCMIRGVTPWPGAYTYLSGKLLKVHRAYPSDISADLPAGRVVSADKNGMVVRCGKGSIVITELQIEGKKRMACADFVNGCKIAAGEILG